MPDLYVRFSQWSAGNAGRIDPAMAPANAWYGTNVQMYPTGLVGPRWGLKQVTVNGPSGTITIPVANGPKGFAVIGNNLLITADRTYLASLSSLATGTVTATQFPLYSVTPSKWVTFVPQTDSLVFALVDNALYKHDLSLMTTTAVTTPSAFNFIRRWNLYCVGVDNTTPYRVWFSQVNSSGFDFSTWPATNYIDVGDNEPITAVVPLYNTLFVGKRSGWWAITGVIGTTAAVRQVSVGDGPVDARGVSATADNRVAYWPRSPNPAFFNGSGTSLMLDHSTSTYSAQAAQAVVSPPTGRTTLFGYDNGATSSTVMVSALGGPSLHTFGVKIAGWAPDTIENGYSLSSGYVLAAKQSSIAGEALSVYYWRIDPDRPPLSTDTLGSYGDASTTPLDATLQTRAWFEPQGRDVRVRTITVHLRAWGIGSASNKLYSGLGCSVECLAPYDNASFTSAEQHWRLPYGETSTTGEDFAVRFAIGEQGFGQGFRVNLTDMRGVAIRDVIVGLDLRSQRA